MRNIFYSVLMIITITVSSGGAQGRDPQQLTRFVVRGEFAAAIDESDRLVADFQKLVRSDPDRKDSWTTVHILEVGYYTCAKAQVLALKGDHRDAELVLKDAEYYAASHPDEFASALAAAGWKQIVEATRGLILEKEGKRDAARKTYQETDSEYARGRLALMSLKEGDEAEARRLALQDISEPTADLVLGRLEEKAQNPGTARKWYDKAWTQIQTAKNQFMPIYFCEGKAILEALERLKN